MSEKGNFYSDSTGSNVNQLNIHSGSLDVGVVLSGFKTYTVTSPDVTATYANLASGLTTIHGYIVQIYRAGILLSGQTTTVSTTNLRIATNGATYVLTAGDVLNYYIY